MRFDRLRLRAKLLVSVGAVLALMVATLFYLALKASGALRCARLRHYRAMAESHSP